MNLRKFFVKFGLFVYGLAFCFDAAAEPRYALLIGNSKYPESVGPLKFPSQDVDVLEKALEKLNFKVRKIKDVGFLDINKEIAAHIRKVRDDNADVVLSFVYYAGHGAADIKSKVNYLIPVDVTDTSTSALWGESINLQSTVITALSEQASNARHFVVIDACRNELKLRDQNRALTIDGKGFIPATFTRGMVIAFASQENSTTPDNGMFAKILAKDLLLPAESMVIFRAVQLEMQQVTGQSPFAAANGLAGTYFTPPENGTAVVQMLGPDTAFSRQLPERQCPEITFTDYSVIPPITKVERRCMR